MSRETITRLRALDPERRGATAPPIDRLLARLDAEPDGPRGEERTSAVARRQQTSAPRGSGRRRPRRPIAAAVALVCLAAVAVAALLLGGGNAAEQRDDAFVPANDGAVIVHTVARTTIEFGRGRRGGSVMQDDHRRAIGTMDGPVERWSTTDQRRWRSLHTLLPGGGGPGGTMEQAYADGILRMRDSWSAGVRRIPGRPAPHVPGAGSPGVGTLLMTGVADPRATVEEMLDSGEATQGGSVTRDGRRLLRLVAVREEVGRRGGRGQPAVQLASRSIYLLDAETYAPVEVELQIVLPDRRSQRSRFSPWQRTVFDVYETLPLTSETAALLRFGGPTG